MSMMNDDLWGELEAERDRLLGDTGQVITTMPFGKFENVVLTRIPRGYLRFILSAYSLSLDLRRAIEDVVQKP